MFPDELKKQLSQQFEILDFVDLADVVQDPSLGYRTILDQRLDVFGPNQRIVFYASGPVKNKTLNYIKHAADLFDVSACFVLVCAPEIVTSDLGIDTLEVPVYSTPFADSEIINVESLCALPWFHLEYMNAGDIRVCCYTSERLTVDPATPLKNLIHCNQLETLRGQMLKGENPLSCSVCWERESKGYESLRQWRNKEHRIEFFTNYLSKPSLKSLVIRANTVCNFKCRICDSDNSSLWAQEDLRHETDPMKQKQTLLRIEKGQWFDQHPTAQQNVLDVWPDLEFIDIYGGEPLMIKQFKKLLMTSINAGVAHSQRLHFNTNASLFPVDLIELMHQFKKVMISLSIDDIGERFEIERGGSWPDIDRNVDKFLSCDPKIFEISAHVTVSNLNVLYLDELLDWANSKKLPVTLNMLHNPNYLRYDMISAQVKQLIIDRYHNHQDPRLAALARDAKNISPASTEVWISKMQRLDQIRNQSLLKSHAILAQAMGYK